MENNIKLPNFSLEQLAISARLERLNRRLGRFALPKDIFSEVGLMAEDSRILERLAIKDPLTGLYSRQFMPELIESAVSGLIRQRQPGFGMVLADMDEFKRLNDHFGHECGDQVLRTTAERLVALSRGSDLAFRLGGDEFLVYLDGIQPAEQSKDAVLERYSQLLNCGVPYNGRFVDVSVSLGFAEADIAGLSRIENFDKLFKLLLSNADKQMYTDKKSKRASD